MSVEVLSLVVTVAMVGSSSHGFIYVMLHTGFRKMLPRCRSTMETDMSSGINPPGSTSTEVIEDDIGLTEIASSSVWPYHLGSGKINITVIAE